MTKNKTNWTDQDIDAAYFMGVMNSGTDDIVTALLNEIQRLKEFNMNPHDAVRKIRHPRIVTLYKSLRI